MTSITGSPAPSTDLLGRGGADVRAGELIMAGAAGTGTSRTASASGRRPTWPRTAGRFLAPGYLPQHDGTIPGIRSPGRPLS